MQLRQHIWIIDAFTMLVMVSPVFIDPGTLSAQYPPWYVVFWIGLWAGIRLTMFATIPPDREWVVGDLDMLDELKAGDVVRLERGDGHRVLIFMPDDNRVVKVDVGVTSAVDDIWYRLRQRNLRLGDQVTIMHHNRVNQTVSISNLWWRAWTQALITVVAPR